MCSSTRWKEGELHSWSQTTSLVFPPAFKCAETQAWNVWKEARAWMAWLHMFTSATPSALLTCQKKSVLSNPMHFFFFPFSSFFPPVLLGSVIEQCSVCLHIGACRTCQRYPWPFHQVGHHSSIWGKSQLGVRQKASFFHRLSSLPFEDKCISCLARCTSIPVRMSSYVAVILNEERVQVFLSFFSVSLFPWWCLSCLSFATFVFLFSLHISLFFFCSLDLTWPSWSLVLMPTVWLQKLGRLQVREP